MSPPRPAACRSSQYPGGIPSRARAASPLTRQVSPKNDSAALAAARSRIVELEARDAAHERAERVQSALYRIAETAGTARDMAAFYAAIHQIVGELIYADNFFIALYDEARQRINFPFYRDEVDPDIPDPNVWEPFGEGNAAGSTAYVLRHGSPELMTTARLRKLAKTGEVRMVGAESLEWMGAPLKSDEKIVGVVAVQTYREDRTYDQADLDLLTFVAQHIGAALSRARAIGETRQRNQELALVNEVGAAVASQLEFDKIIELVGERIREIFGVETGYIALYDAETKMISFPYQFDKGEPFARDAMPLGTGLTSRVLLTKEPLRLGRNEEADALGAVVAGSADAESWLGVPILAGERVLGAIGLERMDRDAFDDADERLLSTLASSMGVALDNARLFNETNQRNAELAIVNEIGEALAKQLDFDAIIELVGARLAPMFGSPDMYIGLYDRATNTLSFPYELSDGRRVHGAPMELGDGLSSKLINDRRPLRFGTAQDQTAAGGFIATYAEDVAGSSTESWLGVPIMVASDAIGVIAFGATQRNAFSESDERVLSTIASSMGVALENARLFDETKRLLTETDERAAELAVINSVQEGLVEPTWRCRRCTTSSATRSAGSSMRSRSTSVSTTSQRDHRLPVLIDRGVRLPDEPIPISESAMSSAVLDTGQPLLSGT